MPMCRDIEACMYIWIYCMTRNTTLPHKRSGGKPQTSPLALPCGPFVYVAHRTDDLFLFAPFLAESHASIGGTTSLQHISLDFVNAAYLPGVRHCSISPAYRHFSRISAEFFTPPPSCECLPSIFSFLPSTQSLHGIRNQTE